MNSKFGKIEKFIESMDIEAIDENAKALMLVGDNLFGGANSACDNYTDCRGSTNSGCTNHDLC